MKTIQLLFLICFAFLINACSESESKTNKTSLTAIEFSDMLKKDSTVQLVDVRTPEEFSKGSIGKTVNIDWNSSEFKKKIAAVEKTKPVLVYCLSGKRSASAA